MASPKLPPKSLVSFIELKNRCPRDQIHNLDLVIEKNRKYKRRVTSLQEGLPPIDWEYYKRNVRAEAVSMVETFQKKYTSFAVPKPADKHTPQIAKLKEEVQKEVTEFVKKSNERIAAYQKEMERIRSMMPYDQMTWEDYCTLYPKDAPDFINRPTFWPHNEDEQIGYVESAFVAAKKGESKMKKKMEPKKEEKKKDDKKKGGKK